MNAMLRMVAAICLMSGFGSCLCAAAEFAKISVTDDRGRPVVFSGSPQRIVTLLPSLTESVCTLDACERIVGTDRYSNWPMMVVALPKLGGLEDAAIEGIVALRPDVVLAGTSSRVIDRLEELGIAVVALEPKTLADTHRVLDVVATLLGRADAGESLWARIDVQIAAAAAAVPKSLRGQRVYFEVSEAPYAAGASSFIGELLRRLGLGNVIRSELGPFPKLNPEYVIRARPDLIMSSATELAGMRARPGWNSLNALRRGRTCGFDASENDILVRPGPRLGEAAELILACLKRVVDG